MHDQICDCPCKIGLGPVILELTPAGKRKYPPGCPKRPSQKKTGLRQVFR
jgi:hypothetical protein